MPKKTTDPVEELLKGVERAHRRTLSREKSLSEDISRLATGVRRLVARQSTCGWGKILIGDMKKLEHTYKRLKEEERQLHERKQEVVDALMKTTDKWVGKHDSPKKPDDGTSRGPCEPDSKSEGAPGSTTDEISQGQLG